MIPEKVRRKLGGGALYGVLVWLLVSPVRAELRIEINQGQLNPVPVALTPLAGSGAEAERLGRDIIRVVEADLQHCGLFRSVPEASFIQKMNGFATAPRFSDWRMIDAQALTQGIVQIKGSSIRVDFRLFDVFAGRHIDGLSLTADKAQWRKLAHMMANAVYCRLTGESKGYFDSRVFYVSRTGFGKKQVTRLAVMDYDGENHHFLTQGQHLVLMPSVSPDGRELAFLAFVKHKPRVYLMRTDTGQTRVLGDFKGMTLAPAWSPDGRKILLSYARHGRSAIYEMDPASLEKRPLTDGRFIDTSPCYSPDQTRICFESDRSGTQQIYIMRADGTDPKRITFSKGSYATPVWSPREDWIAFTKILNGTFYIGVIRPDGKGERLLAQGYLVEGPTWAPGGRRVMYFRQDGKNHVLCSIDITGHHEKRHVTPADALHPAWTP
jgi:TolB protein